MTDLGDAETEFCQLLANISLIGFSQMASGLDLLEETSKYWTLEDYRASIREMRALLKLNAISIWRDRGPW